MLLNVAKRPQKKPSPEQGKRKPGRPSTGIGTNSFCCRAPLTLKEAFDKLAAAQRLAGEGTALLHAAEEYIRRMYVRIKAESDSRLLDAAEVPKFFAAAEAYFAEAGEEIPTRED